ncbi:bifunctional riboflavin kinase/FAD synthetase [Persephonella sp.]
MKVLKDSDLPLNEKTVCSIGSFDGFHIGHTHIIETIKKISREKGLKSLVITFNPHPKIFLNKLQPPCIITDLETKLDLLSRKGVDFVYVINFNENFLKKSPYDFLKFLSKDLGCSHIIVGEDWRFGYMKEGDITFAREKGKELGITVEVIKPILKDGIRISSTRIRNLLREGKVKEASKLLGREYCIKGNIVKGSGRGKDIGFPTINIIPSSNLCLRKGVYAGFVSFNGERFPAVINYGYRPTVDGKSLFIEAHVINGFSNGKINQVRVFFKEFLRPELKFEDIDQLRNQIKKDIEMAKKITEVKV